MFVALCFKVSLADVCDGSPASNNWLSLADDFVAGANAAVAAHGLHVQFVLDGVGVPGPPCLQQRWRPWNATFISGTNATDPAFTSNDPTRGFDRFAVLNEPSGAKWAAAVQRGYGKFVNSTYNYQVDGGGGG